MSSRPQEVKAMTHAVIDTNVLVSVLLAKSEDSSVVKIVNAVLDGRIVPLYNQEILDEYANVLSRPKFGFDKDLRELLVERISTLGVESDKVLFGDPLPDESDRVFYEIALSVEGAFLITGNLKHFPHEPIVVTPAQMLEILDGLK